MSKFDELTQAVTDLQAAVDADQASDAQVVRDLQAQIDALTAQIAAGATPEQLQSVVDSLKTIQSDVSGPNA